MLLLPFSSLYKLRYTYHTMMNKIKICFFFSFFYLGNQYRDFFYVACLFVCVQHVCTQRRAAYTNPFKVIFLLFIHTQKKKT